MDTTHKALQQQFETIRDCHTTGANTAERLGEAFLSLLSYVEGGSAATGGGADTTALEKRVGTLESKVATLESEVQDLMQQVEGFEERFPKSITCVVDEGQSSTTATTLSQDTEQTLTISVQLVVSVSNTGTLAETFSEQNIIVSVTQQEVGTFTLKADKPVTLRQGESATMYFTGAAQRTYADGEAPVADHPEASYRISYDSALRAKGTIAVPKAAKI